MERLIWRQKEIWKRGGREDIDIGQLGFFFRYFTCWRGRRLEPLETFDAWLGTILGNILKDKVHGICGVGIY